MGQYLSRVRSSSHELRPASVTRTERGAPGGIGAAPAGRPTPPRPRPGTGRRPPCPRPRAAPRRASGPPPPAALPARDLAQEPLAVLPQELERLSERAQHRLG